MSNTEPKDPKLAAVELDKAHTDAAIAKLELKLKREDLKRKKEDRKHQAWLNQNSKATEVYNEALEDFHYGVVSLDRSVTASSVFEARQALRSLLALRPGEPIRFEINSPGGSAYHGLALFDDIRRASDEISATLPLNDARPPVTTVITGRAASMAGILSQAGDWRVIGPNAYLHLHAASAATWGKSSEMDDDVEHYKALTWHAVAKIYAERATQGGKPTRPGDVFKLFDRRELWLNATEALEIGFVDEIA